MTRQIGDLSGKRFQPLFYIEVSTRLIHRSNCESAPMEKARKKDDHVPLSVSGFKEELRAMEFEMKESGVTTSKLCKECKPEKWPD